MRTRTTTVVALCSYLALWLWMQTRKLGHRNSGGLRS
jgi:hypothetical protein